MATVGAMAAALEAAQNRMFDSVRALAGENPELDDKLTAFANVKEYPAQPQIAQTERIELIADILDLIAAGHKKAAKTAAKPDTAPESGKGSAAPSHSARAESSSPAGDSSRAHDMTPKPKDAKK